MGARHLGRRGRGGHVTLWTDARWTGELCGSAPAARLCHDLRMPAVRISVGLPQLLGDDAPDIVQRFAVRAEELGFAGLWTLDSVPGSATSRMRSLEGLHTLTVAAVVTQAIRLGVAVIVLPERQPGFLARELATIDQIDG